MGPMTTGHHEIEVRKDRFVYTLQGAFDEPCVQALRRAVEVQDQSRRYVLVDMRQLRHCSRGARRALVDVHRQWANRAQRVVYLASEGRMRGLSLWIVHMAGDEYAKAVGSDKQAEIWLTGSDGRQEQAFAKLGLQFPAKPPVRSARLGLGGKLAARALAQLNRYFIGEPLEWLDELIRMHGVSGTFKCLSAVQKAMDHVSGRYGDLNAQTMFGLSSMWNGCRSCSRGHILAANIIYYEATERLFPLYEEDALVWQRMTDAEMMADICQRMCGADDLVELRQLIEHYFDFKTGTLSADSPHREAFVELDAMWTVLNECSITDAFRNDFRLPRMPKLHRKRSVIAAYRKARGKTP